MSAPRVRLTETTSVRGKFIPVAGSDAPVQAFLGIPYARPPVGERRFLAPEPLKLWEGERDCTEYGAMCPQDFSSYGSFASTYRSFPTAETMRPKFSEADCLLLNICTPNTETRLPVMVYIHGGCFCNGSGQIHDVSSIAALNSVVSISINYRLGVFGFLTTGDDVVPGNAGLLDQVEALKWIKKYIFAFGGDPDNVTVWGGSAGGMSASLHMVSDLTKGLFKRIICHSGVANSTYAVRTQKQEFEAILPALQKSGYTGNNSSDILKFLQTKTVQELLTTFQRFFKPVIDGNYLKDYPHNLYQSGTERQVEVISGHTTHESIIMIYMIHDPSIEGEPDQNTIRDYVKKAAEYGFSDNIDAIADTLFSIYFKREALESRESILRTLIELYSDMVFNGPAHSLIRRYSDMAPTYGFLFSHRPSYSAHDDWIVSDHTDDLAFALGFPFNLCPPPRVQYTEEEKTLSRLVMSYWANFARTGNPNGAGLPTWPKFSADKREYMCLQPMPEVASDYSREKMDFWDRIVPKIDTGRIYKN